MRKTFLRFTIILYGLTFGSGLMFGQPANPRGTAEVTVKGKKITIEYGRPQLRGRDMLAQARTGAVWRMGADQATTLTTEADLLFGNTAVPQGNHQLQAKNLVPDQWELLVNVQSQDGSKQVVAIPLQTSSLSESVEMLTIALKSKGADRAAFSMTWGTKELKAEFKVK